MYEAETTLEGLREKVQDLGQEVEKLVLAETLGGEAIQEGLGGVRADIGRLEAQLAELSDAVSQAQDVLGKVSTRADDTHAVLATFVERYGRDQIVANAQSELSRLTTEWTARFAQRRQVRALARGLVHGLTEDAVSRGVLDKSIVEACSQELLLKESSFWLAPALVAVAAGYSRDAGRIARARSHALTLDQPKATLFFALTCSRQKRQDEAARWMDLYLAGLDSSDLGQEFTIVLDAVAGAELGFEALTYARQAMARWDREANARHLGLSDEESTTAHVVRWTPWMAARGAGGPQQFDTLRELCVSQWASVQRGWEDAMMVKGTLDYLRYEYSAGPLDVGVGRRTDIAIQHLIDQFDPDEQKMQEQMGRLRSIIEHRGDTEEAAAEFVDSAAGRGVNLQDVLERALFEPQVVNLGYSARLLSIQSSLPSLRSAVVAVSEESVKALPDRLALAVDDWTCWLPGAPIASDVTEQLIAHLDDHAEGRTVAAVNSVELSWPRVLTLAVIGLICGGLALLLGGPVAGLATAASGGLVVTATWGVVRVPFHRRQLREDGDRRRVENAQRLEKALDEHTLLFQQWNAALAVVGQFSSWSPATVDVPEPNAEG
ncbi:hypothetical protein [Kitasatospora sp. NPDC093806]|uniref:hypothetical protein n=1 Tax=Kitasatospora sp. NPDC093806 TaxID=3155075 RepID=UPI00343DBE26